VNCDFRLYGYVILENHLHVVASCPDFAGAMKSFKMFTAHRTIELRVNTGRHRARS